eukprot:c46442_g1_i1 orf=56-235(+)
MSFFREETTYLPRCGWDQGIAANAGCSWRQNCWPQMQGRQLPDPNHLARSEASPIQALM